MLSLASGMMNVSIVRTAPLFLGLPINLQLIISDHGVQEFGITFYAVQHVLCDFQVKLLLLHRKQLRHEFCGHLLKPKSAVRMVCTDPMLTPTSSASSRTVI